MCSRLRKRLGVGRAGLRSGPEILKSPSARLFSPIPNLFPLKPHYVFGSGVRLSVLIVWKVPLWNARGASPKPCMDTAEVTITVEATPFVSKEFLLRAGPGSRGAGGKRDDFYLDESAKWVSLILSPASLQRPVLSPKHATAVQFPGLHLVRIPDPFLTWAEGLVRRAGTWAHTRREVCGSCSRVGCIAPALRQPRPCFPKRCGASPGTARPSGEG